MCGGNRRVIAQRGDIEDGGEVLANLTYQDISTHTYLLGQGHLIWLQGMKSGRLEGRSTTEAVTILLRAIRLLYLYQRQNTVAMARINTVVVDRIR